MRIFSGKTTVENVEQRRGKGSKGKKSCAISINQEKKNRSVAAMVH